MVRGKSSWRSSASQVAAYQAFRGKVRGADMRASTGSNAELIEDPKYALRASEES